MRDGRREFLTVLVAGAAGAGLILLASRQVWAHAVYLPPRPLPRQDYPVRGQRLIPLASALAVAGLACLAAVVATQGVARRLTGVLLAVMGAAAVLAATAAVTASAVLSAASAAGYGGVPGHAELTGLPWRVAAVTGGVAMALAGLAAAWRGGRWPAMSARYERSAPPEAADPVRMWESLSHDSDPT